MQIARAQSRKQIHPVVAFALNLFLAAIGAAIVDRLQTLPFWHQIGWSLGKAFTISAFVAGGLGFATERFWSTRTGKWVWTVTTALFLVVVSLYAIKSCDTRSGTVLFCVWRHFAGTNCMATLRIVDCRDTLIFTSTFLRGLGYSVGAGLAEVFVRVKHRSDIPLLA